jgi:hypothetical protein
VEHQRGSTRQPSKDRALERRIIAQGRAVHFGGVGPSVEEATMAPRRPGSGAVAKRLSAMGDRWFESFSLQRGGGCELNFGRDAEGERYLSLGERIRFDLHRLWMQRLSENMLRTAFCFYQRPRGRPIRGCIQRGFCAAFPAASSNLAAAIKFDKGWNGHSRMTLYATNRRATDRGGWPPR